MQRTQVQLTEEQDRGLDELSRIRRVSKSELVRQAVDQLLAQGVVSRSPDERRQRALAVVGRHRSGHTDTGRNHDDVLTEAYRS